jgi:hypothetical protein
MNSTIYITGAVPDILLMEKSEECVRSPPNENWEIVMSTLLTVLVFVFFTTAISAAPLQVPAVNPHTPVHYLNNAQ